MSGPPHGTAEVESALVSHDAVSEAAVVGYPHDIKGQGIYCYITLMEGQEGDDALRKALVQPMSATRSARLPRRTRSSSRRACRKTRSGKIMRRILRKIAEDEFSALGDTSTLADPGVVDDLIANRQNKKS
jgi:acetyl-CoA synthetase